MINFCSFRPSPAASHQPPSIRLRCRDFNFIAFHFDEDGQAQPVFESIRRLTCRLESVDRLYAFSYRPPSAEKPIKCWGLYNPVKELERMGITQETRQKTGWRITNINAKYEVRHACTSGRWLTRNSTALPTQPCSACHTPFQTPP
jgi:myotubularin-related protein 6/7/8